MAEVPILNVEAISEGEVSSERRTSFGRAAALAIGVLAVVTVGVAVTKSVVWGHLVEADIEEVHSLVSTSQVAAWALEMHNARRAQHQDTPDMEWDAGLAAAAAAYARTCPTGHSRPSTSENLAWAGTTRSSGIPEDRAAWLSPIDGWYNEERFWDYSSSQGNGGGETGHFTQMVWKATTKVGCAMNTHCNNMFGSSYKNNVVVCRYNAGNMRGRYAQNVASKGSGGSGGGGGSGGRRRSGSGGGGGSATCTDMQGWKDASNDACSWYNTAERCEKHGHGYSNQGHTANTACCLCGGGQGGGGGGSGSTCTDLQGWKDSGSKNPSDKDIPMWRSSVPRDCSWYDTDENMQSAVQKCWSFGHAYKNQGHTANTACCSCRRQLEQCQDDTSWTDSQGHSCNWYRCSGKCRYATAITREKCCICKWYENGTYR